MLVCGDGYGPCGMDELQGIECGIVLREMVSEDEREGV